MVTLFFNLRLICEYIESNTFFSALNSKLKVILSLLDIYSLTVTQNGILLVA